MEAPLNTHTFTYEFGPQGTLSFGSGSRGDRKK